MVKESKFINRGTMEMDYTDEYWERRYTVRLFSLPFLSLTHPYPQLRDGSSIAAPSKRVQAQAGIPAPREITGRLPGGACVPPLLEGWKHKVLLAGKYLNVIKECGIEIQQGGEEEVADDAWALDGEKWVS